MHSNKNNQTVYLTNSDYREELLSLIRENPSKNTLREHLSDYHENDIAGIIPDLTRAERMRLYDTLEISSLSDVFSYLEDVDFYISELENTKAADIIEEMDADDVVDVLEQLHDEKREAILKLLATDVKRDVNLISSFDDTMIGSKMTTNFIVVQQHNTIKEVMRSLVHQAAENDNVQKIYVLDKEKRFYGAIDLRDLIIARQEQSLESIVATKYPFFLATTPIDECIEELQTYSEDAIPILDGEHRLIGVITASDVAEVVQEEATEDYAKFAGLTEAEDLNETLTKSIRKRIPWLLILLVLGLLVSAIIQRFQNVIPSNLIIIYTFQSLILGMSGNTGTQSLAVAIRVLSDSRLSGKDTFLFILKEMRVGVCNGLIVGGLSCVAIGCYLQLLEPASIAALPISGFAISGCIGLSLFVAMTIASLSGTIIPMLFKKIGIDPAVASGPLITTLNDLVAVCSYYGLSILFFVSLL